MEPFRWSPIGCLILGSAGGGPNGDGVLRGYGHAPRFLDGQCQDGWISLDPETDTIGIPAEDGYRDDLVTNDRPELIGVVGIKDGETR